MDQDLIALGVAYTLGLGIMSCIDSYRIKESKVNKAYTSDINNDSLSDIVVKDGMGNSYIFLQQEDGSYKLLKQVEKEARDSLTADYSRSKKSIEAEADSMEARVRE